MIHTSKNRLYFQNFFNRSDEIILHITCVIFLIFIAQQFFSNQNFLEKTDKDFAFVVRNFLFLNIIHAAFTFPLVFSSSFGKKFQVVHEMKGSFYHLSLFIFAIFFLIFYFHFVTPLLYTSALALALSFVVPKFHILMQVKGISMMYVDRTEMSEGNQWIEKFEKYTYLALGLSMFSALVLIHNDYGASLILVNLFTYLTWFLAGMVFIFPYFYNKTNLARSLFNLRIFLFPLLIHNSDAAFLIGATHGIEYFLLFRKMTLKESKALLYQGFLIAIIIVILTIHRFVPSFYYLQDRFIGKILFTTTAAIGFLHYYLDSQFFKMKNPIIQKILNPVLKPS